MKRNVNSHYRKMMKNLQKKLHKFQSKMHKAFCEEDREAYEKALLKSDAIKDDIADLAEEWHPSWC